MKSYDAIIVGGGISGLSAGLWLARYQRSVRILDSGKPRNDPTWAVHGYPGISDPPPHELRRVLLEQAKAAGAEWEGCQVTNIEGSKNEFVVTLERGVQYGARRVVLSYGRIDVIPPIEGAEKLYGKSVFHCPDCDGPSMIGSRLSVYGKDRSAAILALYLLTWGESVTLLTDGQDLELDEAGRAVLGRYDVAIQSKKIARLCDKDHRLAAVEFADGDALPMDGLFFHLGSPPASDLAAKLGCKRDREHNLEIENSTETTVAGVYAAGDLAGPPYLAISAAAKGVKTAMTVHRSLLPSDQEL